MTTTKKPLNPQQRKVVNALARASARTTDGWVPGVEFGSETTLWYAVRKGHVEVRDAAPGPRGGERFDYRPVGWSA